MSQFIVQGFEDRLLQERKRIVGLCATLTGNKEVAEDLAQEVLLEAWRSIERLRDTEQFSSWLSGITRNVCLRWMRKQGRSLAQQQLKDVLLEDEPVSDFDVEIELEHKELVELLDRALSMLPSTSRDVLIARYVEESSLSEVAERLGLHVSTAAMRLKRGKLALRQILDSELELYGYSQQGTKTLKETSVWCTFCGQHRLQGRLYSEESRLILTCPECGDYSYANFTRTSESQLFQDLKRIKPALSRLRNWTHRYYNPSLNDLMAPCLRCELLVPLHVVSSLKEVDTEHFSGRWMNERGVYQMCDNCQLCNWTTLQGIVLSLPEGQHFLQVQPQIRALPVQQIEANGQSSLVICFESVTAQARFETIVTSDTYRVLSIDGRRYDGLHNAF